MAGTVRITIGSKLLVQDLPSEIFAQFERDNTFENPMYKKLEQLGK